MAHLGRNYKLLFRRDLHLDVVNRDGIPEAFQVTFNNIVTPFGTFVHLGPFTCAYFPIGPGTYFEFRSPSTVYFGHSWDVVMQLWDLPTRIGDQQKIDYFIVDDVGGSLFVKDAFYRLGVYYGFTVSPFSGIVTPTPGYSWASPAQSFSGIFADWSVYP